MKSDSMREAGLPATVSVSHKGEGGEARIDHYPDQRAVVVGVLPLKEENNSPFVGSTAVVRGNERDVALCLAAVIVAAIKSFGPDVLLSAVQIASDHRTIAQDVDELRN